MAIGQHMLRVESEGVGYLRDGLHGASGTAPRTSAAVSRLSWGTV